MPPFTSPQNPIPEPKEVLKPEGIDPQTKNVMLFAIIFSVLAAGVLAYTFLKPERKSTESEQVKSTTTSTSTPSITASTTPNGITASTTTPINETKSPLSSLLDFFKPKPIQTYSGTESGVTENTGGNSRTTPQSPETTSKTSPSPDTSSNIPPSSSSSRTSSSGTQTQTGTGNSSNVPTRELTGIYGEPLSAEDQIQLQFFNEDLPSSPLRGKIWISSVNRSGNTASEYFILSTSNDLPANTTISGMTAKSVVSGESTKIGQGVFLPIANQTNQSEDIKIGPGEIVYVATGRSPLGYSFRLNLCTGYFEQFQDFSPGLPTSCPLLNTVPRPAPPNHLQDACIDYIQNFGRCAIITALPSSVTSVLNQEQQYRCLMFIQNNTGYQTCVDRQKNNANFYSKDWRTYLNRSTPLWKTRREIIWLLDQQGKFVSQYSY